MHPRTLGISGTILGAEEMEARQKLEKQLAKAIRGSQHPKSLVLIVAKLAGHLEQSQRDCNQSMRKILLSYSGDDIEWDCRCNFLTCCVIK